MAIKENIYNVIKKYADFIIENSSSAEMTDENFFQFLSTQKKALNYLNKKGVDIEAFQKYCQKGIAKSRKYNQEIWADEISFNDTSDMSGFLGSVLSKSGYQAGYNEFIDEMVVAINASAVGNNNSGLFDFADKEELDKIIEMGFDISKFSLDKAQDTVDYANYEYQERGYELLITIPDLYNKIKDYDVHAKKQENQPIIVGFEEELEKVYKLFNKLDSALINVSGDFGVGKSSFVKKIKNNLKKQKKSCLFSEANISIPEFDAFLAEVKNNDRVAIIDDFDELPVQHKAIFYQYVNEIKSVVVTDKKLIGSDVFIDMKTPSTEETLKILSTNKTRYENHHKLTIDDDVLKDCIELSNKHLKNLNQPLGAFTLLDTSCAFVKDEEYLNTSHLQTALNTVYEIPNQTIFDTYSQKIMHLPDILSEEILGQTDAFNTIRKHLTQQIIFPRSGKPKASFIFAGSSGVGKTQTAKNLAKTLGLKYLQYDMGEYSQEMDVNKFLGSAAGYVGYDEGGKLVNDVSANPNSLIVFDEIEKANPKVVRGLLSALEEARLQSGNGKTASFEDTIIILTTNSGFSSQEIRKPVGYGTNSQATQKISSVQISDKLSKDFPSEFLSRVNAKIAFQPLSTDVSKEIIKLNLNKYKKIAKKNQDIDLDFTPQVTDVVLREAFSQQQGARNIENYIREHILSDYSTKFLNKELKSGDKVVVTYNSQSKEFVSRKAPKQDGLVVVAQRKVVTQR
ncbi:MAG: AAA family ATPase [Alphaproteobacteria bacterium]